MNENPIRTAWVGRTSAVSLHQEVAHKCSQEGCTEPGMWLHWRYRNADSEQGEHSMIEGWLFCADHGREQLQRRS